MLRDTILSLAAATTLVAGVTAQNCSDNVYALRLVTSSGALLPTSFDPLLNETSFTATHENVYLAFDSALPSGTYYVHVTDNPIDGNDEVLSTNDPMDRFVTVTNNGGVITLALPYSSNPITFGTGLGGVGQSLPLFPFAAPTTSDCRFKAWFGNAWDLTTGPANPYLILGGLHPTLGTCAIRSYSSFRIGDGNGSDVTGLVFHDQDRDGVRDAGEPGLGNWEVRLVNGAGSVAALTSSSGAYAFTNVAAGPYTVELTLKPGYIATNAAAHTIQVCACGDVVVSRFGVAQAMLPCNARTIGYWRNCHGLLKVLCWNILPTLPALEIVNACGQDVSFWNVLQFKCWLQNASAWNMAYMLSAQLTAMHCNTVVGFVHPQCLIKDPYLGTISVQQLMQLAVVSLTAHPFTPVGHPQRAWQQKLKNALDNANNNKNWL